MRPSFIILLLFLFVSVSLNAQVTADFTVDKTIGCSPLIVHFTDSSTGPVTSWSWSFGNGNQSSNESPFATYAATGTYTVRLIVSDGTNYDTLIKEDYITVLGNPSPGFVSLSGAIGCTPYEVEFEDQSTGEAALAEWLWDFGDGSTDTLQNPVHIYDDAGFFSISLQVTDIHGCDSIVVIPGLIEAIETPIADFTPDSFTQCAPPVTATFTNNSTGAGSLFYFWDFGDGNISSAYQPSHQYTTYGDFTVSLSVTTDTTDNACSDTIIRESHVSIIDVVASFTTSDTIYCPSGDIQFTNTSLGSDTWFWNFGDGNTSTDANPVHAYINPGIYTVTLSASISADTCTDTYQKTIEIEEVIADFTASPTYGCELPLTVYYTDLSTNAVEWQWHLGNGTVVTDQNPVAVYGTTDSLDDYHRDYFTDFLIVTSQHGCQDIKVINNHIRIILPIPGFTSDDGAGCAPLPVTFWQLAQYNSPVDSIVSYEWDFDDGNTATGDTVFNTFGIGEFEVNMTVTTALGCEAGSFMNITAGSQPDGDYAVSDTLVCASDTVYFYDMSTPNPIINRWYWIFSLPSTGSGGPTAARVFQDTGYVNMQYYVGYNGCYDTILVDSIIYVKGPICRITRQRTCEAPLTYTFGGNLKDATRWYWDFGDGGTDSTFSDTVVHTFPASGNYSVALSAFNDSSGCSYYDTLKVYPVVLFPDFLIDTNIGCPNQVFSFDGSVSENELTNNYIWIWGDGEIDTVSHPDTAHRYIFPGTYKVRLIVTDMYNCKRDTAKYVKIYYPDPDFAADTLYGCSPLAVNFSDLSVSDTTLASWTWYIDDTIIYSGSAASHTFVKRGSHKVALRITDVVGCINAELKNNYITVSQPATDFSSPDTMICYGDSVHFQAAAGYTYLWDFGDSNTSTESSPVHYYADTGFYSVTLMAADTLACDSAITKQAYIHVQHQPVANFRADTLYSDCYPLLVHFFDSTEHNYIGQWKWNFGDGTQSSYKNPSHNYAYPGLYDVRLVVVTTGGCRDTVVKDSLIEVNGPTAGAQVIPDTICLGNENTYIIENPVGVASIVWDFGEGDTVTVYSDTVHYTLHDPGWHYASVHFGDVAGECKKTATDSIFVHHIISQFNAPDTAFCVDYNIGFTDESVNPEFWEWDFGDGNTSSEQNPEHRYGAAGNYIVSLITSLTFGCSDTLQKTTHIHDRPATQISNDTSVCYLDTLQLSASGADFYFWSPSTWLDNVFIPDPISVPDSAITYYINYAVDSFTCDLNDSVTVTVMSLPVSAELTDTSICERDTIYLNAGGGFQAYQWSTGDTLQAIPVFSPDTFWVKVTDGNGCRSLPDSAIILIDSLPRISLGADTAICYGDTLIFDAGYGFVLYEWYDASTDQQASCFQADTVFVTVEDTNTCRNTSEPVVLAIITLPVVSLQNDTSICDRDTIPLFTGGGFTSYFWSTGETTDTIRVADADTFSVIVGIPEGCLSLPDSVVISVYPLPEVHIGADTSVCVEDTVVFRGDPGYDAYYWFDGSSADSVVVITDTNVLVTLFVTDSNSCRSPTDSLMLIADSLPVTILQPDTGLCYGDSLAVNAGPGYDAYWWSSGGMQQFDTIWFEDTLVARVQNSMGCWSHSDTVIISIFPLPVISLGPDTAICRYDSLNLSLPGYYDAFFWSTGETTDNITVSPPGTQEYFSAVQDSNTCRSLNDTMLLTVYPLPVTEAGNDTAICFEESITFTADSGFVSYLWSDSIPGQSVTLTPDVSVLITLNVEDTNGCRSFADSLFLTVDTLPEVNLGSDTGLCSGDSLVLDAGEGYNAYWWIFGDTVQFDTVFQADTLISRVQNSMGCWSYPDTIVISIFNLPSVYLGPDTGICDLDSVFLDAGEGFVTYWWSTDDSIQTPVFVPHETQEYVAAVQDSNTCWSPSDTIKITVFQLPVINLGNDTSICDLDSLVLDASEGFPAYFWSDGSSGQILTVISADTLSVVVESVDGCYSVADTIIVGIDSLPVITLGNDTSICYGAGITLCPGGGFTTYHWSTGASDSAILHTTGDTVSVYVYDSNSCRSNTAAVIIGIDSLPAAVIVPGSAVICAGDSVVLDGTTGFEAYTWSTGDTMQVIVIYPELTAQILLNVTDENGCESIADTMQITVNQLPQTNLADSILICPWDTIYLNGGDGMMLYNWSTGETTDTITVHYEDTIILTVTDTNNCVSVPDTSIITFDSIPVITLGNDTSLCDGDTLVLDAGAGYTDYLWSDGTGNQTYPVAREDTVWVIVQTTASCKSYSDTVSVGIYRLPVAGIGNDTTLCFNNSFMVDAGAGFAGYLWSDGSSAQMLEISPVQPGYVFAWVFDSNTCRSLPDTLYYSLVPAPEFEFAADSILICPRDKTELDAGTGYAGYAWSTGDSTQSILTGRAGSYFATVTDGTCYTVDTVTVYIVPLYVSLPPDTYLCDDETMDLNVENENAVYEWSTGETSPHITIYPGVRWIRVTVHKENCVLSDSIYIDRCPDWPEHVIELPNAFSPNGDGYNDQLKVLGYYITNLDLMIFNRFGKLLYRTSDPDEAMSRGWDGTYEGKLQETDVYVYHLSATFTDGSAVFKKGNITLLK